MILRATSLVAGAVLAGILSADATCTNDNLHLWGVNVDTSCASTTPICVGSDNIILATGQAGTQCVTCVNNQEIDAGEPDLGCSADLPRCMTSTDVEAGWNAGGTLCAANLPVTTACHNTAIYGEADEGCPSYSQICVARDGMYIAANTGDEGYCCVPCVNVFSDGGFPDYGCPDDKPRCVLENMADPPLNMGGDLCKENPTAPEETIKTCDAFDDRTGDMGSSWVESASAQNSQAFSIVNGKATADNTADNVISPFVYHYTTDLKNDGRKVAADVTIAGGLPVFVGIHFLQKERFPLYVALWMNTDGWLEPGAYIFDGAYAIAFAPFAQHQSYLGDDPTELGGSFHMEVFITAIGEVTLELSDFDPSTSTLSSHAVLSFDLGTYPYHMDTLELKAGISTNSYDPAVIVTFDNFQTTGCGGVTDCTNDQDSVQSAGAIDTGCTSDSPVCTNADGTVLGGGVVGDLCAVCINSNNNNFDNANGWNDDGCPLATPKCVNSDGATEPAVGSTGAMCVSVDGSSSSSGGDSSSSGCTDDKSSVLIPGAIDTGCTSASPVCVDTTCYLCLNSKAANYNFAGGWNDEGCPLAAPKCVNADGVTEPAVGETAANAGSQCIAA